jgi:hypothetical protein
MMGSHAVRISVMDTIVIQLGQGACEAISMLGAIRGHCNDYVVMRIFGFCLLGMLLFLASFITMSRTHPIGRM